jgi:methionine biosynthesis protein MetW
MYREIDKTTVDSRIVELVEAGASVFDIGCGNGELLQSLIKKRNVKALGLDIKSQAVLACLDKGIPAIHGDLDSALDHCKNNMYDYVILSRTLQVLKKPHEVLKEIVRIGKKAIVAFPNFGHLPIRWFLMVHGRMPKSKVLPFEWYDSPNIHHLTVRDFRDFCRTHGINILHHSFFGRRMRRRRRLAFPNLLAKEALFVIQKKV